MFKTKQLYECPYCKELHKSEEDTLKCLNSHNLIYQIQKLEVSHDCWGKSECNWINTDMIYKDYIDAFKMAGKDDYQIKFIKLQ